MKAPVELKYSKRTQTLYQVASDVANFKCGKGNIDPRTGDLYIKGKLDNDKITYRDAKSLIFYKNSYKKYYIKRYGFFIETTNENEIKEINEREMVISRLTE